MKLSMSRIDSCEKNLRISFMEKKYDCRTAISMPKKENVKVEEPFKEIFRRDESPVSTKNDFDRPFRKMYYGPLPPNRSPSSTSLMPQRSMRSVWQRFRSYMSTQKQRSFIGLRKMSSVFKKGSKAKEDGNVQIKNSSNPVTGSLSGTSSKKSKGSKSKSLGFKTPIEDQELNMHTPKLCSPSRPLIHKPQTPETSKEAYTHKSVTPATISLDEGKSLLRGSSLNIKKTIVYTHDLLYLTEEDRKQKHEAERKKQEETPSKTDPEAKRLHPLREVTHSLLDVINPLSRSPSSHDLNSSKTSKKHVSKKSSIR